MQKEIENARCKNYFGRIENFYRRLPKTECQKCGKCCYDPPVCTLVEFMYAYELYDTLDKKIKCNILIKALRRYFYSLIDKFSEPCCFLDNNNMCRIYTRSCLSYNRRAIMEKLKLYVVTKSSTDKAFKCGDLIWLSENGDLNNVMGPGWISEDEWNVEGRNDFEYKVSNTYYLEVVNGRECVRKMNDAECV